MKGKQSFITGAIVLGTSGMIAKFLGLFFRWPVTMLIGDEGIGLYQLAYPVYMFIIGIMSGFPVAISSMVAERAALGKRFQAYRIFKCSFFILGMIGIISSVLLFACSPYLIKVLRWREDAYYSLAAVALAPAFISIVNCFRGYFQGLQMMAVPAVSQIVEQLGRVVVGVGLTYLMLPYGISYSAAGASLGAGAGAFIACILLVLGFISKREYLVPRRSHEPGESTIGIMGDLLKTALPISLGMTVASIMSLIDSIVVPGRLLTAGFGERMATELYGQLTGKAHVLINVPLTLSTALGVSLVPAMSEVKALRNITSIKSRAESAVKVAILLGLPSTAGLFILAEPILHLIFPGQSQGADVLQILSISVIFIVLVQTFVSLLQGVGDVISPVRNLMIGSVIKLILVYMLTAMPGLNVKGAAVSSIAGYMVAAALNFRDVLKRTYFSFDIEKMLLRPVLSVFIMSFTVYTVYNKFMSLHGSSNISTMISIITGIIVYAVMLIFTGCISLKDMAGYIKSRKSRK